MTGDTFDALMNYPLTEALLSFAPRRRLDKDVVMAQHEYREFVRPIDAQEFASRLDHLVSMYPARVVESLLNLLDSHDTPRFVTSAGGDVASLRLALLALMTLPGAPCIYYGDEVGLAGRHDPDSRRAFPWDDTHWDHDVLELTRALAALRKTEPALRRGAYATVATTDEAIAYARLDAERLAVVALNAGDQPASLVLGSDDPRTASLTPIDLPGWSTPTLERGASDLRLTVAPRSGSLHLSGSVA